MHGCTHAASGCLRRSVLPAVCVCVLLPQRSAMPPHLAIPCPSHAAVLLGLEPDLTGRLAADDELQLESRPGKGGEPGPADAGGSTTPSQQCHRNRNNTAHATIATTQPMPRHRSSQQGLTKCRMMATTAQAAGSPCCGRACMVAAASRTKTSSSCFVSECHALGALTTATASALCWSGWRQQYLPHVHLVAVLFGDQHHAEPLSLSTIPSHMFACRMTCCLLPANGTASAAATNRWAK